MSLSRFSGGSETSNNTPDNPIMWPHNFVQSTSCGHFLEMNNTTNGQRVRLVHGKTRNYIDMDELREEIENVKPKAFSARDKALI